MSWRIDQNLAGKYILPVLGAKKLDGISAGDILAVLHGFREEGRRPATRNRILSVLRSMFRTACKKGLIGSSSSPVANIPNEVIPQKSANLLSADDLRKIMGKLEASPAPEAKFLHLMLLTNAGKSELLNAKWQDFSEADRTLVLKQNYKTDVRAKEYLLLPKAVEIIKSLPQAPDSPWLFPGQKPGKPMSDIYYFWNKLRRECDLPGLKLRDLQVSLVVSQIKNGAHIVALNEIFGQGFTLQARKIAAEA